MNLKGNLPILPPTLPDRGRKENYLFLLGAKDAEMDEIERLLLRHKMQYQYATCNGVRVHPGNAYQADPVKQKNGATIVLVECEPTDFHAFVGKFRRIDHHREGDPGYGLPAEFYWESSSIGQIYMLLKKKQKPSRRHLIIAVRDHCRFKVKQCPGVTSKEVSNYGRHIMALELGIRRAHLDERIQNMRKLISRSARIELGNAHVADMRKFSLGNVYSLDYFSAFEALADLESAALVRTRNIDGDAVKVVLMGNVGGDTVHHFMNVWAPQEGLTRIYGCAYRGHAGGYYENSLRAEAA